MQKKKTHGFTLIELIVVISLIGILVLLAAPRFLGQTEEAIKTRIINDIGVAETKLDEYLITHENLDEWDSVVPIDTLTHHLSEGALYSREGLLTVTHTMPDDEYSIMPSDFVSREVKSSLGGTFYASDEGSVYYQRDSTLNEENESVVNWNGVPDGSDGEYPEWTEQELFTYEIVGTDYARITGYYGANPANSFREELDVVIPEYISEGGNYYPVRVIGEEAFSLWNEPDASAPTVYTALRTVHIPNTVTEIEDYAFFLNGNITKAAYLGRNIEKIGYMAFSAIGFERLVTTESLVELSEGAFAYGGESALRTLDMSYSIVLKELPRDFIRNATVSEFVFPPNLEVIGDGALATLAQGVVTIPESVHTIGEMPFGEQHTPLIDKIIIKDINSITFTNNGTERLGIDGFVTGLNSVTGYADHELYLTFEQPFLFDKNSQTIELYWHEGQSRDVKIPETINGVTVKHLADKAFYKYNIANWHLSDQILVDSVTIPETIETIGDSSFSDYYTADGQYRDGFIFEGDKVTHIGHEVFYGAASKDMRLPNSVESINISAFTNSNFESINIPHNLVEIPVEFMFMNENLAEVIIGPENQSLEVIQPVAFFGTNISTFYVPENVRVIGSSAFYESSLSNINIPDSANLKVIESAAFYGTNLSSVNIPDSVEHIGGGAFYGTNITEVSVPEHTVLEGGAFPDETIINRR